MGSVYITSAIMPPPVLPGSNDSEKLATLCSYSYKDQAVWFLNAFWTKGLEGETERLWGYVQQNNELDLENHADGCALDEMKAHVFLEKFSETLTVREMRDKLRSTGAIGQSERPKLVPLTHYLLFRYEGDWHHLVNAPQGDNKEEIERAQQMLKEVQEAYRLAEQRDREATAALKEAQAAEKEAKAREADAKAREAEALEAEAPFKAAQEEVSAALAEVHKQEAEYQGKIADCERRSNEGGVVQANKAKAELAQLKAEDPLPLRKAKITLEAAEKRATKARAPFEAASKVASEARAVAEKAAQEASSARSAATSARQAAEQAANQASQARAVAEEKAAAAVAARQSAEQAARAAEQARVAAENARQAAAKAREQATDARKAAEQARQAADQAKQAAEQALDEASRQLQQAEAYLADVRSKPGVSHGQIWWIDRELHEQKKYLPTSRGGIAK